MSNQSDRQASVRASTGTALTYEGDWHALFDQAGIAVNTFDCRLLAWINAQLGASYVELNGAMQAYAVSQGAPNWAGLGTLTLLTLAQVFNGASGFYFDFTSGATGAGIASVSSVSPGTASASQATSSLQPNWTVASPGYAKFDGVDDELLSTLLPAAGMTLAGSCRFAAAAASQTLIGGQTATANNDRCRVGIDASGRVAAAWGSQIESTIFGGSSIAGTDAVILLRANGSTVELWLNAVRVYQGAPSGTPSGNVTRGFMLGANNGDGAASLPANARLYRGSAIQRYIDDAQVAPFMRMLGAGVLSF